MSANKQTIDLVRFNNQLLGFMIKGFGKFKKHSQLRASTNAQISAYLPDKISIETCHYLISNIITLWIPKSYNMGQYSYNLVYQGIYALLVENSQNVQ